MAESAELGVAHPYGSVGFWNEREEAWHDFAPGIRRRILLNTSAVTLTLYILEPAAEVALHSHPQLQFGYCNQGHGKFTTSGKTWDVEQGDSYYIPPDVTHGLKVAPDVRMMLVEGFIPMRREFLGETLSADGP